MNVYLSFPVFHNVFLPVKKKNPHPLFALEVAVFDAILLF